MEKQEPPERTGCIVVDPDQLDEEGWNNLLALVKLLIEIDSKLAAEGRSPIQHLHDQHAKEIAEQKAAAMPANPKRRRRRKHYPAE